MMAVGLSLIFGTTGLTNFAHGEIVVVGTILVGCCLVPAFFLSWYAVVSGWTLRYVFASMTGAYFDESGLQAVIDRHWWQDAATLGKGIVTLWSAVISPAATQLHGARILQAEGRGLTIVFTRTKRTAAKVSEELLDRGLDAVERGLKTKDVDGVRSYVQTLSQTYPSPIDDVWDAMTSVERTYDFCIG